MAVEMRANYKGSRYVCRFSEGDKFQDTSRDKMFYYHGGKRLSKDGDSKFYFLVFVTYDDYLAWVYPMPDVSDDNYDVRFESVIRRFERSPDYKRLYDFHYNRCIKLIKEQNRKKGKK